MNRLTHKARYEAGYKLNKGVQAWQAADMLGAYENTGLTPVEIMDGKLLTGWILVEERLPECEWGAETSGLLYQCKETGTIEVGYYGRGGKIRDSYFRHYRNVSDGIDSSDVIAWMPLPEPYRPEN